MASPLLEIPGARRRRTSSRGSDRFRARPVLSVNLTRPPLSLERRRRRAPRQWYRDWSRRPVSRLVRWLVVVALVAGLVAAWRTTFAGLSLDTDRPLAFPSTAAGEAPLRFRVDGGGSVRASLSGVPISDVARAGRSVEVRLPSGLPEGGYELEVSVDRPFPFGRHARTWAVTIDDQPPALALSGELAPVLVDQPTVLSGTVEAGAELQLLDPAGTPFRLEPSAPGTFTITLERPPAGQVELVATDPAGNQSRLPVIVPVAYPADTRAAHITAVGWASEEVRKPFLDLIDRGVINTVQLDIKDESGDIGYDSQVPLAREVGAVRAHYDVREALDALHGKGVRVIGRVVAFRDPLLTRWAWQHGHADWVVQDTAGQPFSAYGGFANYLVPEVQDYNLAVAQEAVTAGFDEILWDYVRRPEGDPADMVVPGLTGSGRTTGDVIVEFLGRSQSVLRPLGAYQGASVFGIAATRPENIGQPVDRIATVVDYVAPMVYPSHYVDGECGVASPKREPHAIVACSLGDFRTAMSASNATLLPWLQDFSLDGVAYGPNEVAQQIKAAGELGAGGFLLWNPSASYTYDGRPA